MKDLIDAEGQHKNISDVLNSRMGNGETYDTQFIRNMRTKIKEKAGETSWLDLRISLKMVS